MELKEEHKRLNSITGKPFEQGFIDQNGRVFYSYVNKIGNDGWYLEEWKKIWLPMTTKKRRREKTMTLRPFHLAIPVSDIPKAREFYGTKLGFDEGRSDDHWIDY